MARAALSEAITAAWAISTGVNERPAAIGAEPGERLASAPGRVEVIA